jgi:hypothetical protein
MEEYIEESIKQGLQECIEEYGLEGAEQVINETYSHKDLTITREKFLNDYYLRIWS